MNSSDILKDDSLKNTPLKTNMSPKNQWLEAVLPYCLLKGCPFFGDMNRWFSGVYHCQGTWSSTTFKPLNLTNASGVPSVGGHLHPLNKAGFSGVIRWWSVHEMKFVKIFLVSTHDLTEFIKKRFATKDKSLYTCCMLHLQTKKQMSRRSWLSSLSDFSTIAVGKD